MRKVLCIEDHELFHRAVVRTVLAGGAVALLPTLDLPLWLQGLLAVPALSAALSPPRSLRAGAALAVRGVVGAGLLGWLEQRGALGLHTPAEGLWQAEPLSLLAVLGVALCVALALAPGAPVASAVDGDDDAAPPPGRGRRALQVLVGVAAVLAGLRVAAALPLALESLSLPGQLASLCGGLGAGLVLSMAALLPRLRLREEALRSADLLRLPTAALAPSPADDELADLMKQAATTYQEAASALTAHKPALRAAEELMQRIARFGQRWQDISAQARRSDPQALGARLVDLQARREASSDEQVRSEYQRAAAAVQAQLDTLKEIGAGRERAVARLHHQVATLERLRLTALRHRSADAARQGEELRALVDELTQAGAELDTASEALAEVSV